MTNLQTACIVGVLTLCSALCAEAAVVEGTFEGIVTTASDPAQTAFGRDPALWVGKAVSGSFRYDISTTGVRDANADSQSWTYVAPWGLEWVEVRVIIDGVEFDSRSADPTFAITGTVQVWDDTFGGGDWFSVQAASIATGRKVVGFDVYGPPALFSYAGGDGAITFQYDAALGARGLGIVEDLYEPGGIIQRHGLIRFQLTSVTFGKSTAQLLDDLLAAVRGVGPGTSLADKVAAMRSYYTSRDSAAACSMLSDFLNQLEAQAGKKLTSSQATSLMGQAYALQTAFGCE